MGWFLKLFGLIIFSTLILGQNYKITNYSVEHGLSNTRVQKIIQDQHGFIWIATADGLNRFDTYNLKQYFYNSENPNTLLSNVLKEMIIDKSNNLWITGEGGLNKYDSNTDRFNTRFRNDTLFKQLLGNVTFQIASSEKYLVVSQQTGLTIQSKLETFFIDSVPVAKEIYLDQDIAYVGTSLGLFKIDLLSRKKELFQFPDKRRGAVTVSSVQRFNENELLISVTNYGLYRFSLLNQTFTKVQSLGHGKIYDVLLKSDGHIWIADEKTGITIYDKSFKPKERLLRNQSISSLMESKNGLVFAGSLTKGFYIIDEHALQFRSIKLGEEEGIYGIEKRNNILSVLTFKNGLIRYDLKTKKRKFLNKSSGLNSNDLVGFYRFNNKLWIGTYGQGINIVDEKNNVQFKKFKGLGVNYVNVFSSMGDTLYIGTYSGILIHSKNTNTFEHIKFLKNNNRRENFIVSVTETKTHLWLGTSTEGLIRYDKKTKDYDILKASGEKYTLNGNGISDLYVSSKNTLYVGTSNGLSYSSLTDPTNLKFHHISRSDGLKNESIYGIQEDSKSNIWFSTGAGIAKLNTITKTVNVFQPNSGISDFEYNNNSDYKDENGTIYFGGLNGVTVIDPLSLSSNTFKPKIVFTDFSLFNKKVEPATTEKLKRELNTLPTLELNYDDYVFSVSFALLNYTNSNQNRFAYRLKGFNDRWVDNGSKNSVTFTNLDPGDYVLYIKGFNNDGIESGQIGSLKINVSPPWWKTTFAYILYIFGLFSLVFGYIRKKKIETKRLESLVAERTAEVEKQKVELEELNKTKSLFFQNITHEFRTPLTLIISPLEQMIRKEKNITIESAVRNAKKLLKLVNQLIDVASNNHQKVERNNSVFDFSVLVRTQSEMFKSAAETRDVRIITHIEDYCIVSADREKLEYVISNLLSNATKFTTTLINIICKKDGNSIIFICEDDGIGINEKLRDKIFERFYQIETKQHAVYEGTGIGLALVKSYVELHGGEVNVNSIEGSGSTFTVHLPIITEEQSVNSVPTNDLAENGIQVKKDKTKDKILLVEDSTEIRNLCVEHLSDEFYIIEAIDGFDGFKKAKKELPKLILADVMMPKKDGYALTKELKSELLTSHIPVLLITAKSTDENKIEGLSAGADDYIVKPFNIDEVRLKIRNHIQRIKRQQLNLQQLDKSEFGELNSMDSEFMTHVTTFVQKNISDYEFDFSEIYHVLGMSQSTFYRKLKSLTNLTPTSYVLNTRLEIAAELLQKMDKNVSEVSNTVGISNTSYFSRSFTKKFGISPKEYQKSVT